MEHYELLFIVPGSLTDEEAPETISKVKKLLEDLEGKIIKEENWGRKTLEYKIDNQSQGTYAWFEFDLATEKIAEVNKRLRLSREILRFLVTKSRVITEEEIRKDEEVKKKIESKKKDKVKEQLAEAEKEKEPEKQAQVKEEKPKAKPKPSISMDDLDKKLDDLLIDDLK
ncbi:MAG: 30S ribosomal protein S6 [Patescibacteria group bacterium]